MKNRAAERWFCVALVATALCAADCRSATAPPLNQPPTPSETWLSDEQIRHLVEAAPRPLSSFISRRANCNHWAGEYGYDDGERVAQIAREERELRCDRLAGEERTLRRAYANQPKLLRLLALTTDFLYW